MGWATKAQPLEWGWKCLRKVKQTSKKRKIERGKEGAVNPFPTVCHTCGLTQTGKQAALLRKTSKHPTEKIRAAVWEWERASERERDHDWQFGGGSLGCAAYLFGCLLPVLENKQLIWQHSGRTGQRLRPSLCLSISSHICSQSAQLHNIHKHFFPSSNDWWLTFSPLLFNLKSYRILRHVVWAWSTNWGSQWPPCGGKHHATTRLPNELWPQVTHPLALKVKLHQVVLEISQWNSPNQNRFVTAFQNNLFDHSLSGHTILSRWHCLLAVLHYLFIQRLVTFLYWFFKGRLKTMYPIFPQTLYNLSATPPQTSHTILFFGWHICPHSFCYTKRFSHS